MNKRIVAIAVTIICFLAIVIYIARDWNKSETPYDKHSPSQDDVTTGQHTPPSEISAITPADATTSASPAAYSPNKKPVPDTGHSDNTKIDPRLKNITISSVTVEDPEQELSENPERLETVSQLRQFTMPIKNMMEFFPSFAYTGEMELEIPTFTNNRNNYDGEVYTVRSEFKLVKDDEGDFRLFQTSNSNSDKDAFSAPIYNGTFYLVDGKSQYYDSEGNPFLDDRLAAVEQMLNRENGEPLVRKKWIEIIRDIEPVIDLELVTESEETTTWNIVRRDDIDEKNQKLKLLELNGTVTALTLDSVITSAQFSGKGTYQEGFMKGATVRWNIRLNLSQIGNQQQVYLP